MPIFRFHRGGLDESLKTCILVKDISELVHLAADTVGTTVNTHDMAIEKYGPEWDNRIGWYTHIVSINGAIIGFLSEDFSIPSNSE